MQLLPIFTCVFLSSLTLVELSPHEIYVVKPGGWKPGRVINWVPDPANSGKQPSTLARETWETTRVPRVPEPEKYGRQPEYLEYLSVLGSFSTEQKSNLQFETGPTPTNVNSTHGTIPGIPKNALLVLSNGRGTEQWCSLGQSEIVGALLLLYIKALICL